MDDFLVSFQVKFSKFVESQTPTFSPRPTYGLQSAALDATSSNCYNDPALTIIPASVKRGYSGTFTSATFERFLVLDLGSEVPYGATLTVSTCATGELWMN